MKKCFIVILILVSLCMLVGCGSKSKAKKGYKMRKEEQTNYYVANGLEKDSVKYSNCFYIYVKSEKGNMIYYKANYSLQFPNGSTNTGVDYFEWDGESEFTATITPTIYEEILGNINDKTLDGDTGELKK